MLVEVLNLEVAEKAHRSVRDVTEGTQVATVPVDP